MSEYERLRPARRIDWGACPSPSAAAPSLSVRGFACTDTFRDVHRGCICRGRVRYFLEWPESKICLRRPFWRNPANANRAKLAGCRLDLIAHMYALSESCRVDRRISLLVSLPRQCTRRLSKLVLIHSRQARCSPHCVRSDGTDGDFREIALESSRVGPRRGVPGPSIAHFNHLQWARLWRSGLVPRG